MHFRQLVSSRHGVVRRECALDSLLEGGWHGRKMVLEGEELQGRTGFFFLFWSRGIGVRGRRGRQTLGTYDTWLWSVLTDELFEILDLDLIPKIVRSMVGMLWLSVFVSWRIASMRKRTGLLAGSMQSHYQMSTASGRYLRDFCSVKTVESVP